MYLLRVCMIFFSPDLPLLTMNEKRDNGPLIKEINIKSSHEECS